MGLQLVPQLLHDVTSNVVRISVLLYIYCTKELKVCNSCHLQSLTFDIASRSCALHSVQFALVPCGAETLLARGPTPHAKSGEEVVQV